MKPAQFANAVASELGAAFPTRENGKVLAKLFDLKDPARSDLLKGIPDGDKGVLSRAPSYVNVYRTRLVSPWAEIAVAHTQALLFLGVPSRVDHEGAYTAQHEMLNELYRFLLSSSASTGWALPLLYVACRDLKRISTEADKKRKAKGEKPVRLEEASRLLMKCFSACLNDRSAEYEASRKMGTYHMAVLLFKVYFHLNSTALCKNITRGIGAADLPPLSLYPKADQVAYNYYMGVFEFLREDYDAAEANFFTALNTCHRKAPKNIELILSYLVPILLKRGVFAARAILNRYPRMAETYQPFFDACKTGSVALYDTQLHVAEKRLMQRATYLVVERAREVAVRGLLKKAWICEGKPARLSIDKFRKCYELGSGGEKLDSEEVECLLANMIYKNLVKGYISHPHQLVVLSKTLPFPWYPPFSQANAQAKAERDARELAERSKPVPPVQVEK